MDGGIGDEKLVKLPSNSVVAGNSEVGGDWWGDSLDPNPSNNFNDDLAHQQQEQPGAQASAPVLSTAKGASIFTPRAAGASALAPPPSEPARAQLSGSAEQEPQRLFVWGVRGGLERAQQSHCTGASTVFGQGSGRGKVQHGGMRRFLVTHQPLRS